MKRVGASRLIVCFQVGGALAPPTIVFTESQSATALKHRSFVAAAAL
jgi:hypothetical protein